MRKAFTQALTELAAGDDRIVLLTADLGFMVLEEFADTYPTRFVNAGVAEANMIALAADMALRGQRPFCYSIATFASMRAYEQIRDDLVLQRLPVCVVGVGGGFGYGAAGPTHFALEDVAIMRAMPGMSVVTPCDDEQTCEAVKAIHSRDAPAYLRLGKDSLSIPRVPSGRQWDSIIRIGGGHIVIVTYGSMTAVALEAQTLLAREGIDAAVLSLPVLAPVPTDDLIDRLRPASRVVTLEDHFITGGIGTIVAELIAEHGLDCQLQRLGVTAWPVRVGSESFMRSWAGIGPDAVAAAVRQRTALPAYR